MAVLQQLVAEVVDRPRREVRDPARWREREAPRRRIIEATHRMVDVTHRPAVTVVRRGLDIADAELARPYLRLLHREQAPRKGMGAKRIPWRKESLRLLDVQPPLYCPGVARGEFAYVDVVRAYPSIYERLSLDVNFVPDEQLPRLGVGRFRFLYAAELSDLKLMHRALGGILRATRMVVWERGVPVTYDTTGWSQFLCPGLWGVICFVLHAIAQDAISEFGCVYVNKDGFVVPRSMAPALRAAIAERYGLASQVKAQGPGTVWGLGRYAIGETSTLTPHRSGRPVHHVEPVSPALARVLRKALR